MNEYMLTEENEKAQQSIQKKINLLFSTDGESTRNEIMNMRWALLIYILSCSGSCLRLKSKLTCIDSAYLWGHDTISSSAEAWDKQALRNSMSRQSADYTGSLWKVKTQRGKKRKLKPNLVTWDETSVRIPCTDSSTQDKRKVLEI